MNTYIYIIKLYILNRGRSIYRKLDPPNSVKFQPPAFFRGRNFTFKDSGIYT